MATKLSNRAELRLAFYRLTGTSSSDSALSEHETSANDTIHSLLYQGMREAQSWYIASADPTRWRKRSSAITWSGTEAADGGRYTALASDFLRLYGDADGSSLVEADGTRWGRMIQVQDRNRRGSFYWIDNDRMWITRGASPPTTLYYEYYYEAPELADDSTAPDFPERDRGLIVAFAADLFADTPQFPGDMELDLKIRRHLKALKERIYVRGRRSREPRKVRHTRAFGSHYFGAGY